MLRKIGRLFVIKTRFEAWLVTYAIAVGAVERGRHYLDASRLGRLAARFGVHRRGVHRRGQIARLGKPAPEVANGPYSAPVRRRFNHWS